MRPRPAPARTAAVLLSAALLLPGCGVLSGGGDDDTPVDGPPSASEAPTGQDEGAASGSGSESGSASGSGAGVDAVDLDDVLVEQTVALTEAPQDQLTVGVLGLTVDGPTMTLDLVITPDLASVADDETVSLYDLWEREVFSPTLLDRPHLTEYSVITDGSVRWSSDTVGTKTTNGVPFRAYATFAAPQDDVESFELRLRDVWPVFTDVPVTP